jgi:hypothetical protein
MNYTLIILGIILIVVIYMLFDFLAKRGTGITSKIDLKATGKGTVAYSSLVNPNSSRYAFSLWVYMDVLNPSGTSTTIFNIMTPSVEGSAQTNFFSLYLDSTLTLAYSLLTADGKTTKNRIMTNFGLQKWVYLIVSVDSTVVDLYVDGKLIRSQQLVSPPKPTTADCQISYGDCVSQPCQGYIAKFERLPNPMDPVTAWSKYMSGNGGNYFSRLLSSYGASLSLTKNNLLMEQYNLF